MEGPYDADYIAKALKLKLKLPSTTPACTSSGLVGALDLRLQHDGGHVTHQTAPGTTECQAGTGNVQEYGVLASQVQQAPLLHDGATTATSRSFAKALRAAGYKGQLMSDDGSLDPHYISEATRGSLTTHWSPVPAPHSTKTPVENAFAMVFKQPPASRAGPTRPRPLTRRRT